MPRAEPVAFLFNNSFFERKILTLDAPPKEKMMDTLNFANLNFVLLVVLVSITVVVTQNPIGRITTNGTVTIVGKRQCPVFSHQAAPLKPSRTPAL